jgi:hypothetical protein
MASYDSDSSDGEFEETNVLLGYASKEADEDTVSKLGGRPVRLWLVPHQTKLYRLTTKSGLVRRECSQRSPRTMQSLQGFYGIDSAAQRRTPRTIP